MGLLNAFYFILTWPILLSVDATDKGGMNKGLNKFTFGNVTDGRRYWAHLWVAWICVFATLYVIHREMSKFVTLRNFYLDHEDHLDSPEASTILITNIPQDQANVNIIAKTFGGHPGGILNIWVNRDVKEFSKVVKDRDNAASGMEGAATGWIKLKNTTMLKAEKKAAKGKPEMQQKIAESGEIVPAKKRPTHKVSNNFLPAMCFGHKVESLTYYPSELERLNADIAMQRSKHEDFDPLTSAFVQFESPETAHRAMQSLKRQGVVSRYMGAHPNNINWGNMNMSKTSRMLRKIGVMTFVILMTIFWAIPVAAVGGLSNLNTLEQKLPALKVLDKLPSVVTGIIQSILPTVALAILIALVPIIFTALSRATGIKTKTGVTYSVANKFFFFLIVNVFFVVSISSGIVPALTQIINQPSTAATILAASLPKAATFFINYILLLGFTRSAGEILRVAPLALFYILGKFLDNTPRKIWNRRNTMPQPNWGTLFPSFTIVSVIGLSYTIVAPIVVGFSMLSFALFYFVYRHQFLYVYEVPRDTETAGMHYPRALYQTLVGVYIMEIVLVGLFFVSTIAKPQGALMVVLLIITIFFQVYMQRKFDPLTRTLPIEIPYDRLKKLQTSETTSAKAETALKGKPYPTLSNDHKYIRPSLDHQPYEDCRYVFTTHPAADWYKDPAMYSNQAVVWLPNDTATGVGAAPEEITNLQSKKGVFVSDQGATMSKDGKIEVANEPPRVDTMGQNGTNSTAPVVPDKTA